MNMKMLNNKTINREKKMRYKQDNNREINEQRMNKKKAIRYEVDAGRLKEARAYLDRWEAERAA